MRHLLHVDVEELAGPLALVAPARDRAAHAGLARDAVDVGQAREALPGHDPGAGAGRHARLGLQRERRQQQLRPGPGDLLLDLGRGAPSQPAQPAAAVGAPLAAPAAGEPLRGGLAADAHLAGGLGHAEAGLYTRDERPAPPGGRALR